MQTPSAAHRWTLPIFLLILAVAFALRAYLLTDQSMWLDEIMTVNVSAGRGMAHMDLPLGKVIDAVPRFGDLFARPWWATLTTPRPGDAHPPLLYLLLRLWGNVLGDSDLSMRAFAMFWSMLSIPLLWFLARLMFDRPADTGTAAALWACALMAVAAPQIQYAQEVRGYSLLQAEFLIAAIALLTIEKRGPTLAHYLVLGAAVFCIMLTHYFAIGAAIALFIYGVVRFKGQIRNRLILTFVAAAMVYAIVWGPSLWDQRQTFATTSHLRVHYDNQTARTLIWAALFPIRSFAQPPAHFVFISTIGAIAFAIPFALRRTRPELLLAGLLMSCTISVLAALDIFSSTASLELFRYVLIATPALYLLVASTSQSLKLGHWRHALPMLLVVYCVAMMQQGYRAKPDWRGLGSFIDQHARPGDAFVLTFYDAESWLPRANLVCLSRYSQSIHDAKLLMLTQPPTVDVIEKFQTSPRAWMLIDSPQITPMALFPRARVLDARASEMGTLWLVEWSGETK